MEPRSNRMRIWTQPTENEDRLSNLSDDILLHILRFLDTLNAVRTSVLSKRWRNLWTSVPSVAFSNWDESFKDKDEYSDKVLDGIVTQVLARRENSKLFELKVHLRARVKNVNVESLVHYAVQHSVEEVHLEWCYQSSLDRLYRRLFECSSLTALRLSGCCLGTICLPASIDLSGLRSLQLGGGCLLGTKSGKASMSLSCPHLETLKFKYVNFPKGTFHIHAPKLRELELDFYDNSTTVRDFTVKTGVRIFIHAPALTTYKFCGYPSVVCLIDSHNFDQAIIYLDIHCYLTTDSMKLRAISAVKMLYGVRLARSIKLPMETIEVLSRYPTLLHEYRRINFKNLKCLKIESNRNDEDPEVPECVKNFFLRSSSMMEIEIE